MIINFKALLYVYSSVLLLLLIFIIRDKYVPSNKAIASHHWPLPPVIAIAGLFSSYVVIKSCWSYIPILKKFEYNLFNWEVVAFLHSCFFLFLVYIFLRYIYKEPINEIFDLKLAQFPFILKVCAILTLINVFGIIFLDFNVMLLSQETDLAILKSGDNKLILLYFLNTIILGPIIEEGIFRGLLYSPLYRKVGRTTAIILTSIIWSHGHFETLLPSVGIFINGLILGWLYNRSGSLIHPIIFHMFRNSWTIIYYAKILSGG